MTLGGKVYYSVDEMSNTTLLSVKDILLNYNPLAVTSETGKKKRGTAYEFQDYAYRLASDLNDLEHLHIYMSYAKKFPQWLLDRTYESIADIAGADNKGALFMWKFKQVRKDVQLLRTQHDFSWENVYKQMRKFRNTFASEIVKKNSDISTSNIFKYISYLNGKWFFNKKKILILGFSSALVYSIFAVDNNTVYGLDFSDKIRDQVRSGLRKSDKSKFIAKDFFKNSYKDNFFDAIIIENFWDFIPISLEKDFIQALVRISKPKTKIVLGICCGQNNQKWNIFKKNEEKLLYMTKSSDVEDFCTKMQSNGLTKLNESEFEKRSFFTFTKEK
ncbi:MAG: hypothetical protein Kow0081_0160 [Candidatus Dojkabacteria bacterium]